MFESFSIIFTVAALLSFINYKWLRLPNTIGQMLMALVIAVVIIFLKPILPSLYTFFCDIVLDTDFTFILLDVMLGFLLFAGALHVDISDLKKQTWSILLFSTVGVLLSTAIIGGTMYTLSNLLSFEIPLLHFLLFGALISPTDPIAVLSLLKSANVKKSLQLKIEGESLFNDGIGVIVFTALLLFTGMDDMKAGMGHDDNLFFEIMELFLVEVGLGLALGAALGILIYKLMKSADTNPFLTTILSMTIVFGGYSLAMILHTSGPLAMVVSGLYIGHHIKSSDFNTKSKNSLVGFWHILDESLNGVLFVFIGLGVHLLVVGSRDWILAISSIIIVLVARFLSVALPYSFLNHSEDSWSKTSLILTWGGLKGGISLALAMSLSPEISKNTILLMTYSIVVFTILVQGLTIPKFVKYIDDKL